MGPLSDVRTRSYLRAIETLDSGRIEGQQMAINSAGERQTVDEGSLKRMMTQTRWQFIGIDDECEEIGGRIHPGENFGDALAASPRHKPMMDDSNPHLTGLR